MKKLMVITTTILVFSTLSFTAYAMGGGMGGGMSRGMGGSGWISDFGYSILNWFRNWQDGNRKTNHFDQQNRGRIGELEQQHQEDSAYLEYQIQMKERTLDSLLKSEDPDIEKARAILKDIHDLRELADQEERSYEVKTGKINPDYPLPYSNGTNYSGLFDNSHGNSDMSYGRGMGNSDFHR